MADGYLDAAKETSQKGSVTPPSPLSPKTKIRSNTLSRHGRDALATWHKARPTRAAKFRGICQLEIEAAPGSFGSCP